MNVGFPFVTLAAIALSLVSSVAAQVSGPCSDCHTMHNSQGAASMNFDAGAAPNVFLARGSCIGCHAQGPGKIVSLSGSQIPQVMHLDAIDLAAGNFAYIYGSKGSGAADSKGHNVIDLGGADGDLASPPGSWHGDPSSDQLTCAGLYGCHGLPVADPIASIKGAHHAADTVLDGATVGRSYRFLKGVTGLEVADWQNTDSEHHNEYHDHLAPSTLNCSSCHALHAGTGGLAAGSAISDLCATCHRDMHSIDNAGDRVWLRHPASIVIPDSSEYAGYITYSVDAPVGRVDLPATPSNEVTPGTDVVTCLSCHMAHGSDHADLLRWDYAQMVAGGGSNEKGCFICHSSKDD